MSRMSDIAAEWQDCPSCGGCGEEPTYSNGNIDGSRKCGFCAGAKTVPRQMVRA